MLNYTLSLQINTNRVRVAFALYVNRLLVSGCNMAARSAFKDRKVDAVKFCDFINPWSFYGFFLQDSDVIINWMQEKQLLATEIQCHKCDGKMQKSVRKKKNGATFRCSVNRNHDLVFSKGKK